MRHAKFKYTYQDLQTMVDWKGCASIKFVLASYSRQWLTSLFLLLRFLDYRYFLQKELSKIVTISANCINFILFYYFEIQLYDLASDY
jgi:hypothetical protein